MVAPNTQKLTAVFLYSLKDEAFSERFGDYLRLLQSEDYLLGITFQDIESLSPYRFREKVENVDFFLFASSPHLFAHANMSHPVFRRMTNYHHTGRLQVIALNYRPWKLEDTLFKNVIRLPENGEPLNTSSEKTQDKALLHIYQYLCQLCKEWMEKTSKLEQSWKLAQRSHEEEIYRGFLKRYPHSRYSEEARNLADNLSEAALWNEASEKQNLQGYFKYLLAPSQQQERQDEAALKITEIEEDEERLWANTKTQNGPEFFIRYKAMYPQGKHGEEADKILRKFLKKPSKLTAEQVEVSENYYLMHLASQHLPAEEYFALTSYLLFCASLRGYQDKIALDMSWRKLLYPILLVPTLLVLAFLTWLTIPETTSGFSVSDVLKTLTIVFFVGYFTYRSFSGLFYLYDDDLKLREALKLLKRSTAYIKVSYLTNDSEMVRKIQLQLICLEKKLQVIDKKNALHYFFQNGQERQEWIRQEEAA